MGWFHSSSKLPHEHFLGSDRKKLVKEIADKLTDGNVYRLDYHGLLKSGKSSIMKEVKLEIESRFESKRILPVYLPLNLVAPERGDFWEKLFVEFVEEFAEIEEKQGIVCSDIDVIQYLTDTQRAFRENGVPLLTIKSFFRELRQRGIRVVCFIDELQAAKERLYDTSELFYLFEQSDTSIVLIGRLPATQSLGKVKREEKSEDGVMDSKIITTHGSLALDFRPVVIKGFSDKDMEDYWQVFAVQYKYQCSPELMIAIEYYAGRSPYLLAIVGEEIEALLIKEAYDSISPDWVRKSEFNEFLTYFSEACHWLQEDQNEKRLLNILLDDPLYINKPTQLDYNEMENAGYLLDVDGEVIAISRRFTEYFIAKSNGVNPYAQGATVDYLLKSLIKKEIRNIGILLGIRGFDEEKIVIKLTEIKIISQDHLKSIQSNARACKRKRGYIPSLVNFFNPLELRETIGGYWDTIFSKYFGSDKWEPEWKERLEFSRTYRNKELAHGEGTFTEIEKAKGRKYNQEIIDALKPFFS